MPGQLELKEDTHLLNKYFPFNIFHNTSDSHNILQAHWHEHFEIIIMLTGSAVFYFGSETHHALPGDILIVNRGLLHSGYSINNTMVGYHAIVFHPSLLAGQTPDPAYSRYISPFTQGQALLPGKIDAESPGYKGIARLVHLIVEEFERKDAAFEVAVRACLNLLVTEVVRHYPDIRQISAEKLLYEKNMDKFAKLLAFVEEHYPEKITIEQASGIVNMSTFHFCKTFKRISGRTFIEFLNMHRINKAEELLRTMDLTVSSVAEKVGFCNINYFDKLFKKYKHYSPSRCRKDAI